MAPDTVELACGALRCTIARRGAELRSLFDVHAQDEFIWQRDPKVWADSAPILFPVVGRVKDGAYLHEGRRYPMPIHGFARHADFTLVDCHEHGATFLLKESPATLACYPFRFGLRVRFTLEKHCLHVVTEVDNPNDCTLPFSLGAHPGFRLPPTARGLADWALSFSDEERNECYRLDGGLLSVTPEPFQFQQGRRIALSPTLFERDALIFKSIRSRHIRLVHRSGRVRLSVATGGAPDLGIWARPGAPYICIEPWYGHDDDAGACGTLAGKAGIVALPAGGVFRTAYAISAPPAAPD
jgi:galactose mutarotase-like enzyme